MTTLADLRASSLAELEQLFLRAPLGPAPRGRFRGEVLARVDSGLAHSRKGALILAPFERLPFGIDFDASRWFFVHPALRLARFRLERGRSRFRACEVLALDYEGSRLPGPIRSFLYDELRPIGEALCLGLGAINAPAGEGDLFFFALSPWGAEAGERLC
jgi:hypothetical protein